MKKLFLMYFFALSLAARIGQDNLGQSLDCNATAYNIPLNGYTPQDGMYRLISSSAHWFLQILSDGKIKIWDLKSDNLILFSPNFSYGMPTAASFSPYENFVVVEMKKSATQGALALLNLENQTVDYISSFINQDDGTNTFAFSPDGSSLAFVPDVEHGDSLQIFDLKNNIMGDVYENPCAITSIVFANEKDVALKQTCANIINVVDMHDRKSIGEFKANENLRDNGASNFKSLVISRDAQLIATHSTKSKKAVTWNMHNGEIIYDKAWAANLPLMSTSTHMVLASPDDGMVTVIDADAQFEFSPFGFIDSATSAVAFTPDDEFFIAGSFNGILLFTDTKTFQTECYATDGDSEINQIVAVDNRNFYALENYGALIKWHIKFID